MTALTNDQLRALSERLRYQVDRAFAMAAEAKLHGNDWEKRWSDALTETAAATDDAKVVLEAQAAEIATLRQELAERDALRQALTFIADLPDPGEEKERSATFYRVHAATLKQIAAGALGRQVVSDEALAWAETVMPQIEQARATLTEPPHDRG